MKFWRKSLAFKIAITIIFIEILVMGLVTSIYYVQFSKQIDSRLEDRMQTAGDLMTSSNLNLAALANPDTTEILVGEEVIDALVVRASEEIVEEEPVRVGNVLFSLNPAYQNEDITTIQGLDETWIAQDGSERVEVIDVDGTRMLTGVFRFQGNDVFVIFRSGVAQADSEKQRLIVLLLGGSLSTIIATTIVIFISMNISILSQTRELVTVFGHVENGDLSRRVKESNRLDEVGVLQSSLNKMITQLQNLFKTLEQRVSDRTRDLQIAADVSRDITTVLDETQLLEQVVNRTKEGFNLYHVSIFKYNVESKELIFQAGSGDIGKVMATNHKKFYVDDSGIVPTSAKKRESILINDVQESETHYFNELLPNTKSELALPMIVGDQLVGVLDLQSEEVNRFTEDDIRVLTTLAEQIAISIQNASSFTEAQRAREVAEQANKVKSSFLASMSHELRTPLNAIINFSRFVAKGDLGTVNEEQEGTLWDVVDSAKHLLNLINDVLDMSKIESGSLKLFIADDIDLEAIIQRAVTIGKTLIEDKPVQIITKNNDNLPLIRGDKQRLTQILLNITSNACKFTDKGTITIATSQKGGQIVISVADTGVGIAEEDHHLVFESFKQTNAGLRQGGGTGLGMPITKNLVEAHGGNLWLESEVGKGSTFYISLPIKSEALVPTLAT